MAKKRYTELTLRRIYMLPESMVNRIVKYQRKAGLPSEVEAARRLIESALKYDDTVETLIETLNLRYQEIRDIRQLIKECLADHPLVRSIEIDGDSFVFSLVNGDQGSFTRDGVGRIKKKT